MFFSLSLVHIMMFEQICFGCKVLRKSAQLICKNIKVPDKGVKNYFIVEKKILFKTLFGHT